MTVFYEKIMLQQNAEATTALRRISVVSTRLLPVRSYPNFRRSPAERKRRNGPESDSRAAIISWWRRAVAVAESGQRTLSDVCRYSIVPVTRSDLALARSEG